MEMMEFLSFVSGDMWIYVASFVLILSLLVFVHEWGHYIVARMCGVHVESFSIGFGKELFGIDDKNGTRWKFSLVPLGGYVQLFGHENPAEEKTYDKKSKDKSKKAAAPKKKKYTKKEREVAFFAKPVWQRAAIVFAGPAINYIFAIILFTGLFFTMGEPITAPRAGAIMQGSAAHEAGFFPGDLIVQIDGKAIQSFDDVRKEMAISLDRARLFLIERDGEEVQLEATPKKISVSDRFGFEHSKGQLGIIGPRFALRVGDIAEIDGQDFSESPEGDVIVALDERMGRRISIMTKSNKAQEKEAIIIAPLSRFNAGFIHPDHDDFGVLYMAAKDDAQVFARYGIGAAFMQAISESYDVTAGTLEALGQMVTGARSPTELGGVIRIGAIAGDMAQQGLVAIIMFTALLSINLGLINMFPIPVLDGGHLVFYAIEAATGKPVPDKFQEYAFQAGLFFLLGLMAFANINDVIQLIF